MTCEHPAIKLGIISTKIKSNNVTTKSDVEIKFECECGEIVTYTAKGDRT